MSHCVSNRRYSQGCCDNQPDSCFYGCPVTVSGSVGPRDPAGPAGVPGGVLNYADFYALMPPDNAASVAPGTAVSFPQNGVISSTDMPAFLVENGFMDSPQDVPIILFMEHAIKTAPYI